MLVLSRQVDEAVMIGDTIAVTVVSINPDGATLHVRYRDENQRLEQKLALEIDDRLEITDDIYVSVLDIRGDKIRLAVVAPKSMAVHRKEVYEAIKRDYSASGEAAKHLVVPCEVWKLPVGQKLRIGNEIGISFVNASVETAALHCVGQLAGGAKDGEAFDWHEAISVGSTLEFGTLVRVSVVEFTMNAISLKIQHPLHMICRIEK